MKNNYVFSILILLMLFCSTDVLSQTTYVPDDNFEAYLETHRWSPGFGIYACLLGDSRSLGDGILNNNSVPTGKIISVGMLDLDNVTDLTGIEDFSSLVELRIGGDQVTSIDISGLINLKKLYFNNSPLLTSIDLSNNKELVRIQSANVVGLTSLDLSNNKKLNFLQFKFAQMTSLDVSNNTELTYLEVSSSQQFTDLILGNQPNINNLKIDNNPLLTNLDLSTCVGLDRLRCAGNNLTELNLSNNLALTSLDCRWNNLLALDLSKNTQLVDVDFRLNNLCSLNIKNGNNTAIPTWDFFVTGNPNLTCIAVDDVLWSTTNWTNIDHQTIFSEEWCVSEPTILFADNDENYTNTNMTQPFMSVDILGEYQVSTNAKNYFYYYIEKSCDLPEPEVEFITNVSFSGYSFPLGMKFLGDDVLQCWLDLTTVNNLGKFTVAIPESIEYNNTTIQLSNIPTEFEVTLAANPKTQKIDLFAGASVGADLLLAGAALGPSIAAAKISASGSAGMGLTFERDESGNQKISRRFEAGVATSISMPSVNFVVGEVKSGKDAGLDVKGVLGQTMSFPNTLNLDITKKAKAAYLLETFALGGVTLSPFAGVFLGALQKSLVLTNPDLDAIYTDLLESNQRGETLEGTASFGFSYTVGDVKLTMSELAQGVTMTRVKTDYANNKESVKFGYAKSYDAAILDFKIKNVDIEKSAFDYKAGSNIEILAEFDPLGVNSFKMSFENRPSTTQIDILSFSKSHTYNFEVPEQVILDNYGKDNVIGSISAMLGKGDPYSFNVGVNSFTSTLDKMYQVGTDTLVNYANHTLMKTVAKSSIGVKDKTEISVALGLGVIFGVSLGMEYSFLDELEYLEKTHIVAEGEVLPMVEHNHFSDTDRIFTLKDEIDDLFSGVALLIQGSLNELVSKYEALKDGANNVLISIADGATELYGNATQGYKWVLRTLDPTYNTVLNKGSDFKPQVRQIYASRTAVTIKGSASSKTEEGKALSSGTSTLYIVSDNVNVNLLDVNDIPIENFDPVTLSLTIDQDKIDELEFTDTEKVLSKMYRYDDANLVWEEVAGDTNADINIVTTQITKSANYAIGIAYDTASDITAPEIQDYYPKQGNIIQPSTEHWAKFYETATGVGIDLSQSVLNIDGIEVEALWNPVDDKLLYTPVIPLTEGEHTFEVIVKDFNGNSNSVISTVTVDYMLSTDIKVLLQGAYDPNTGLMKDDLRANGIIPIVSPYADVLVTDGSVYNLGGISGTGLPEGDIVDWIWIELRDKVDQTIVVASRSALLQRDGNVVDIDGLSPIVIDVDNEDYYVVISHRNHLGIQTVNAINSSTGVVALDFNSDDTLTSGGSNAVKTMSDGKFALFAGDFNGDGQVQNTDKNAVEPLRGISGYNNADIDMNGEVQNTDLNTLLNPNLGKGEQYTRKSLFAKRKQKK